MMNIPIAFPSYRYLAPAIAVTAVVLTACEDMVVRDYEATATVTMTWRVPYETPGDRFPRYEEFASVSLTNYNGEKPDGSLPTPDDKGLWWPPLPPKPTIDQIEQRVDRGEKPGKPEVLREVDYALTFDKDAQTVTLPTDYATYRQAVRAQQYGKGLELTLGPQEGSVVKAEPVD